MWENCHLVCHSALHQSSQSEQEQRCQIGQLHLPSCDQTAVDQPENGLNGPAPGDPARLLTGQESGQHVPHSFPAAAPRAPSHSCHCHLTLHFTHICYFTFSLGSSFLATRTSVKLTLFKSPMVVTMWLDSQWIKLFICWHDSENTLSNMNIKKISGIFPLVVLMIRVSQ